MNVGIFRETSRRMRTEFYARYSMISGTEDDGLSILSFRRLLVISLFWGDFVGAQRHVWVGLVVLWGV